MKTLVATPAYGGNVKSHYASSLFSVAYMLAQKGIGAEFATNQLSEITRARNVLGSVVLHRPDITHVLFIDGDMAFDVGAVTRLIQADKPFVAHVYALKRLNLDQLIANARADPDNAAVIARSLEFNAQIDAPDGVIRVDAGMVRVTRIGMALTLIRREVFEQLAASGKVAQHPDRVTESGVARDIGTWGLFDNLPAEDGSYLGEDVSFCKRWIEVCGGEVYGLITDHIRHIGDWNYGAPYLAALTPARS